MSRISLSHREDHERLFRAGVACATMSSLGGHRTKCTWGLPAVAMMVVVVVVRTVAVTSVSIHRPTAGGNPMHGNIVRSVGDASTACACALLVCGTEIGDAMTAIGFLTLPVVLASTADPGVEPTGCPASVATWSSPATGSKCSSAPATSVRLGSRWLTPASCNVPGPDLATESMPNALLLLPRLSIYCLAWSTFAYLS